MIRTKWPRLLVTGNPVTEEQADHILIRTAYPHPFSNDHGWEATVAKVYAEFGMPTELGFTAPPAERHRWYDDAEAWRKSVGVLDLSYLHNHRIMSAWFGGPYGWCDWSGAVGCSTWNIGKWPSTEEVTADWSMIAEAFPYLDLIAQLVEDEGEGELCGQWRVQGGAVTYDDNSTDRIAEPQELDEATVMSFARVPPSVRERGVTVDRLRQALARVVEAVTR
jgi:hypothetical protein